MRVGLRSMPFALCASYYNKNNNGVLQTRLLWFPVMRPCRTSYVAGTRSRTVVPRIVALALRALLLIGGDLCRTCSS